MIKLALHYPKAGLNISETFTIRKLGKSHAEVLVETTEMPYFVIAPVALDAPAKSMERKIVHYLRADQFAGMHALCPPVFFEEDSGPFPFFRV